MYYCTPNYSVALNAKVGSSSMARAIIRQFNARNDWLIRTAAYPAGKGESTRLWHWMCPGEKAPTKPVLLLVRDPVERFVSAMQQLGLKKRDVAQAIDSLVNDTKIVRVNDKNEPVQRDPARMARRAAMRAKRGLRPVRPGHLRDDVHFAHQHSYAVGPTKCYRFPDHLAEAAAILGIAGPLPKANEAKREKPTLTAAERASVRAYYAADQALFDAITVPGYVYTP